MTKIIILQIIVVSVSAFLISGCGREVMERPKDRSNEFLDCRFIKNSNGYNLIINDELAFGIYLENGQITYFPENTQRFWYGISNGDMLISYMKEPGVVDDEYTLRVTHNDGKLNMSIGFIPHKQVNQ